MHTGTDANFHLTKQDAAPTVEITRDTNGHDTNWLVLTISDPVPAKLNATQIKVFGTQAQITATLTAILVAAANAMGKPYPMPDDPDNR